MVSLLFPKGLTRQVVVVLLLVSLAGVVGAGLSAWQAERQALEEQVQRNLVTVADLKRDRLRSWLNERQADVRLVAVNRLNQEHFTELFDPRIPNERKREFASFLRDNLIGLQRSREGYVEIMMTDSSGAVVIGTNQERVGLPGLSDAGKDRFSAIDGSFFCNIFTHPETGRPVMAFGHVIRAVDLETHQPTSEIIGEVITVVDMEDTVYRILGPIPELGQTAEALLVRPIDEGMLFLSRLMFVEDAALNLVAGPNSPVAEAARKAEMGALDAFPSVDYSGEPVLATYRQVEPVGWGLVVKQSEAEAFEPVYTLAQRIARITLLVLLGTGLLAVVVARTLTRPIGALADATQAIAKGDLSVSLHSERKDELGALSASFQQMVDALAQRDQETQRLTEMLRRRADELESAYSELRRVDQLKDAFIRNITHELRTPVTTLSGYTELLLDDAADFEPDQQEMLQAIAGQSLQVTRLVNDVVSLHNVSADREERRPLRIVEIVRAGLDAWRLTIDQRRLPVQHHFDLNCADEDVEVVAHPGQMVRVLDNLLDNAVKFSPDGGTISLHIRPMQKQGPEGQRMQCLVISISDEGIGIHQEDLPRIWERFYQVDSSTTRRFGGTGLGLTLVKEIVEAHNGQVWVESRPDVGTTVSFALPCHVPTMEIPALTEDRSFMYAQR